MQFDGLKSTHTVARRTRGAQMPDGPLSGPSGTFYPGRLPVTLLGFELSDAGG